MRNLCFTILVFGFPLLSHGQFSGRYIGVGPSITSYKGDLSGYDRMGSGFEVSLNPSNDNKIKNTFSVVIGSVIAQTSEEFNTNLDYMPKTFVKTRYMGLHNMLNYHFIISQKWNVYAGAGIGIVQFKPEDEFGNDLYSVPNDARPDNETYSLIKLMLPLQLGMIYKMKNDFALMSNFKFLNTRTDYLDNISALANPNDKDNILSFHVGILIPIKNPE